MKAAGMVMDRGARVSRSPLAEALESRAMGRTAREASTLTDDQTAGTPTYQAFPGLYLFNAFRTASGELPTCLTASFNC